MQTRSIAFGFVLLVASALSGCSPDDEPPTAPGVYSIRGRVRLTGFLVNDQGFFAGTRVVNDADGVRVELLYGDQVVAATTTVDGGYSFGGIAPGGYVARTTVMNGFGDQTVPLTVASSDLIVRDTLHLLSQGDLLPIPNPLVDTVRVYFEVKTAEWIDVRIRDLAGNTVSTLLSFQLQPRVDPYSVLWTSTDAGGAPVHGSLYWVTFESAAETRSHLLFR